MTIAVQGGYQAEVNMAEVLFRRLMFTGSTLLSRPDAFKATLAQAIADKVWPFAIDGTLRPVMDKTFSLGQAAAAHARLESGEHIGKIVLAV